MLINKISGRYLKKAGNFIYLYTKNFTNNLGNLTGQLFVKDNGEAIQTNWNTNNQLVSISYYGENDNFDFPAKELIIKDNIKDPSDIGEIFRKVINLWFNKDIKESYINEAGEYTIGGETYTDKAEAAKALYAKKWMSIENIAKYLQLDTEEVSKIVEEESSEENVKIKIEDGVKQEDEILPGEKENEEKLENVQYADPDKIFEELETYVKLVGDGLSTALLITGQGGVGKSFTVKNTLEKKCGLVEGKDFVIQKGGITPAGLYNFLFRNYDKTVIFDDSDSVFNDIDSLNILKGALDTDPIRKISWQNMLAFPTEGMTHEEIEIEANKKQNARKHPSSFTFVGGAIFISNKTREFIAKKDDALLTRCNIIDITLSSQGIIKRMASVLNFIKIYATKQENGRPIDITKPEMIKEVFDYLKSDDFLKDPRLKGKTLNFRVLNKVYIFKYAGYKNWKELAFRAV